LKRVGILGLPASGKTTLFDILVQGAGAAASSGGPSREQVGIVKVPDPRIDRLSELFRPKKTTYAQIQFVDSAAAGQGRTGARSSDPFASVRLCDALALVLRDFENPTVPRAGGIDPKQDLSSLDTELIVNDLAVIETRVERIDKELRVGKKQNEKERGVLARCQTVLESGRGLRTERFDADAEKILRGFQLLTLKPLLVVYNQDDRPHGTPPDPGRGAVAVALRAELEREVVALAAAERPAFRSELGIEEDGLSVVIRACYRLLGLISFFTVGPDEVRAWTVRQGQPAVEAAGEIHTDLQRGFIRAEVIGWKELLDAGGTAGARTKGLLRVESREYVVQDGDCMEIRFSA
jgi:GTP-binding protein YchF